jgi:hypothetical protein
MGMATKKISDKVLNIRLGAIFGVAVSRRLDRAVVEGLLSSRAGFSASEANQLAAHWFTTSALRFRDLTRLVVAARHVAFEDQSPELIRELDKASEAFAEVVAWEDEHTPSADKAMEEAI